MTTNAGASDMARETVGFGNLTREGEDEQAVQKMFTPEFRNRLDAVVPFGYLPTEVVARVVDKFILQLELQLADRNVHIQLDDESRAWLTEKGYDKLYGARPMGRLIQEKIKQPARRRAAVRQARPRRRGDRQAQGRRARLRDRAGGAQEAEEEGQDRARRGGIASTIGTRSGGGGIRRRFRGRLQSFAPNRRTP